jgi:hypothetical protein
MAAVLTCRRGSLGLASPLCKQEVTGSIPVGSIEKSLGNQVFTGGAASASDVSATLSSSLAPDSAR